MLKIYWRTVECEIHDKNKVINLGKSCNYVIKDEKLAVSKTTEFGVYTDEAHKAYPWSSGVQQKKRGRVVYYDAWLDESYLREWKSPDATLVVYTTYEEASCPTREFMKMDVADVIAYLKQEGMSFPTPS